MAAIGAAWVDGAWAENSWASGAWLGVPIVQPVLPILKPITRTIDAKTLADHFNRGQIREPDYEWPNRRKFYQDDSPG